MIQETESLCDVDAFRINPFAVSLPVSPTSFNPPLRYLDIHASFDIQEDFTFSSFSLLPFLFSLYLCLSVCLSARPSFALFLVLSLFTLLSPMLMTFVVILPAVVLLYIPSFQSSLSASFSFFPSLLLSVGFLGLASSSPT